MAEDDDDVEPVVAVEMLVVVDVELFTVLKESAEP
jgi:hypothetical protein